jgi:hypothetical protein
MAGRLVLMLVGFAVLAPFLMAPKGGTESAKTRILAEDDAGAQAVRDEPNVDDVVAVSDVEADLDTFDVPGYDEATGTAKAKTSTERAKASTTDTADASKSSKASKTSKSKKSTRKRVTTTTEATSKRAPKKTVVDTPRKKSTKSKRATTVATTPATRAKTQRTAVTEAREETVTTPAPTTTAAPVAVKRTYTADEVRQIIREEWPDELQDKALRIAKRESNFNPRAKNYCCYGLFQMYWNVNRRWIAPLGYTADDLFDPRINAKLAFELYQRAGGWGPWGG